MREADLQRRVRAFMEQNPARDVQVRHIDLTSEIGELGKEILKSTNYGQTAYAPSEAAKEEMGDCLFSLLALCCAMEIDAGAALDAALRKYALRLQRTGGMGSDR